MHDQHMRHRRGEPDRGKVLRGIERRRGDQTSGWWRAWHCCPWSGCSRRGRPWRRCRCRCCRRRPACCRPRSAGRALHPSSPRGSVPARRSARRPDRAPTSRNGLAGQAWARADTAAAAKGRESTRRRDNDILMKSFLHSADHKEWPVPSNGDLTCHERCQPWHPHWAALHPCALMLMSAQGCTQSNEDNPAAPDRQDSRVAGAGRILQDAEKAELGATC